MQDISRDSLLDNVKVNPITGNITVGNAIRGTSHFHDNDASDAIDLEMKGIAKKNTMNNSQHNTSVDSLVGNSMLAKGPIYDPGHLVSSSILKHRKDFRSPYLHKPSTFGAGRAEGKGKPFEKHFKGEFVGQDSPGPFRYEAVNPHHKIEKPVTDSKSMPRDLRVCPIVSKHQLKMPDVSPLTYQKMD